MLTSTDSGKTYQSHESENGYTTPAAQNPNANGCQATYGNGLTGSSGSYDGRHRRPSTASPATTPTRRSSTTSTTSPSSPARRRAAPHLRHRPGPGAAGLVHRRPRRSRPATRSSTRPTSRRRRRRRRSTTAAAGRTCRPRSVHRGLAARSRPPTAARRARVPAGDARPLRLRRRRPRRERPRRRRRSSPACCSPTPTRPTATATSAPTTRRRRARSTPSPSPGGDAEPQRRGVHRRGRRLALLATPARATSTTTRTRRATDGLWRFDFDCLAFNVGAHGGRQDVARRGAYNLVGDVTFKTGAGCGAFDYGTNSPAGGETGRRPRARRRGPRARKAGETGRASTARAPSTTATRRRSSPYAWDFDGDGSDGRSGPRGAPRL